MKAQTSEGFAKDMRALEETERAATQNQTRYVLAELAGAGSYMISMGHLVKGPFDAARFKGAAQALVQRHDALRTYFQFERQDVRAIIAPEPRFEFKVHSASDTSLDGFRTWALPIIFDDVDPRTPGSLIRFLVADYGDAWRFTIAAHHAISDGFSRGVMNRELLKLYAGETLPEAQSFYEQQRQSAGPDADLGAMIATLPLPARLFSEGGDYTADKGAGQFVERDFSTLAGPLRRLAKSVGSTRFAVMSAIYALALSGQTGTRHVSSFFQSEGRKAVGASNAIVGPFSNTLPLDLNFDADAAFSDFARDVSQRVRDVLKFESMPVTASLAEHGRVPTVSMNQYPPAAKIVAGHLDVGPRELLDRRTEYDLNLVWTDDSGCLTARAFYNPASVSKPRADVFLSRYEKLLRAAIDDPDQRCCDVLKAARAGDLAALPKTAAGTGPIGRLHEAVFEKVHEDPDGLAIVTSRDRMTRKDLLQRAMAYRTALGIEEAGPSDRVAIIAKRCPDMVAALLGVSASGASFALIDGSYPRTRISRMVERLKPRYLILTGESIGEPPGEDIRVIRPCQTEEPFDCVGGPPRQDAYHLFTSGTTGVPKLVTVPEATLQRFIAWERAWLDAQTAKPVTFMMSGPSHDPVMRDIFLPLTSGGTLVIPTEDELTEPCRLRSLLQSSDVSVLHVTPAAGRLLALGAETQAFSGLKAVFWGGDRLLAQQVSDWRLLAPNASQINLYGASETPQAALFHRVDQECSTETRVPIGKPMPWTGVRLTAPDGETVAVGEIGEIVIELDAPVGGARHLGDADAAPTHATGDFGFAMPDGAIRFVGRRDRQVQINGYRVELAEIEAAAENVTGVVEAAALTGGLHPEQHWLFAVSDGTGICEADLRTEMARSLPDYMLPAQIRYLARLPLSTNGKVDEGALKALMRERPQANQQNPPLDENERAIASVFAQCTGLSVSDRQASLADLGADSLAIIECRLALEAAGFALPEGWEWRPILELAQGKVTSVKNRPYGGGLWMPVRVDTWMLLRCLAIVQVVLHHAGLRLFEGASVLLITLAGLSFGHMQLPAIIKDERTGRIWAQIARLLIPLVPASFTVFCILIVMGRDPHPAALLFYQNLMPLIDNQILGKFNKQHQIIWLWFLHAYLQIFLLLGALFAFPRMLHWVRQRPWQIGLASFGVAWILMMFSYGLVLALGKDSSTIADDLAWAPTSILPFFCLGLLCALATTSQRKAVVVGMAILHLVFMKWVLNMHGELLWLVGLLACLSLQSLKLPRSGARVVTTVSAHSLMIYLSHMPLFIIMERILADKPPVAVMLALALAVGVALGMAFRPIYRMLGVNRLASKRITFGSQKAARTEQIASKTNR